MVSMDRIIVLKLWKNCVEPDVEIQFSYVITYPQYYCFLYSRLFFSTIVANANSISYDLIIFSTSLWNTVGPTLQTALRFWLFWKPNMPRPRQTSCLLLSSGTLWAAVWPGPELARRRPLFSSTSCARFSSSTRQRRERQLAFFRPQRRRHKGGQREKQTVGVQLRWLRQHQGHRVKVEMKRMVKKRQSGLPGDRSGEMLWFLPCTRNFDLFSLVPWSLKAFLLISKHFVVLQRGFVVRRWWRSRG